MRFNLFCSLVAFGVLVSALPVQAQVLQTFPIAPSPNLSPDRFPSPIPSPFPQPFPTSPQIVSKVCNPNDSILRQYIGIPNDTTVPPRVGLFSIPAKTCIEMLPDGRFFNSRFDQNEIRNRNVFDFCNRVRLERDRFGNPRVVSCERSDINQLDQVRLRGRRNRDGNLDNIFFDILRGRRGLDDGSYENQPR
jgi:hypothetical protein